MSDESSPPELRWIIERIDRNHAETTADIAKLDAQVATIPMALDRYVLARVYEADERAREARDKGRDEQIKELKAEATSKTRGNRSAWLAVISATGTAVVLEAVHALMRSSGR